MSDPLSLNTIYSRLWQAFSSHPAPEVEFTQTGALRSCFAVTDFASASIAVAGGQLAQLSGSPSPIRVDRRLASYWFNHSLYPVNRPPQSLWDPWPATTRLRKAGSVYIPTHITTVVPWRAF